MIPGEKFTKRFLPALLCTMVMLLAACSSSGSSGNGLSLTPTPASPYKQVFVYPEYGIADFGTLDPCLVQTLPDYTAISMLYTSLVGLYNNRNVKWQLAASCEAATYGDSWTFMF